MGRPTKTGLDYFPLDVVMDDCIELIETEHGLAGFSIVIKLWQKIYKNGYYLDWSEDVARLFAHRINAELTLINSVINSCFYRNIFNESLYKSHNVLTSAGIQKRYIIACVASKRKSISVSGDLCLLPTELTQYITEFTPFPPVVSAQSKVKETKVKETITTPISPSEKFEEQFSDSRDIFKSFEKEFGRLLSPFEIEMLRSWINTFNADLILYALKIATLGQNRSFRYIQGILTRWQGEGVKCVQEVEILEKRHQEEKRKRAGPVKNTSVADQNKNVLEAVFGGQE